MTSPDLFSQKLVMPFRIIGCGKGRKWLREGGGIECLLRCFVSAEDRIQSYTFMGPSVATTKKIGKLYFTQSSCGRSNGCPNNFLFAV